MRQVPVCKIEALFVRGRRLLSTYVSRIPLQRKTIGALRDSEQHVLFGSNYDRRDSLDPKPNAAARTRRVEDSQAEIEAAVEALKNLEGTLQSSIPVIGLAVRRCGIGRDLERGIRAHEEIKRMGLENHLFLSNLLIQMYGKCGDLRRAREVFDSIAEKNKFSWSLLVSANAQNGHHREALDLYEQMVSSGESVDDVLLATVVGVCASLGDLESGRRIHQRVLQFNLVVYTALINMYGKCKSVGEAKSVFDRMPEKDVVAWNAMLAAFAQNGHFARQALELFNQMLLQRIKPDQFTFSAVAAACASLGAIQQGRDLHMMIMKSGIQPDVTLENTLLNMYSKCGCLDEAQRMFEGMSRKTVISWSSMVTAYAQNGHHREALELFNKMDAARVKPNCITYANSLSACAGLGDLAQGRKIHEQVIQENCHTAAVVGSALIHMYSRCTCLDEARRVFDDLPVKDLVCTNTMLAGYAQFGHLHQAVEVYRQMILHGTDPSSITLISLIIGASHAGRVEDGRSYFVNMVDQYPQVEVLWEHYMCLIDLLGRSGWLKDAEELVESMPLEPCVTGWITLLSACRIHGDVKRAERAAERVFEMEPGEGAHPILMLGAYHESAKNWDVMSLLRRRLR